LDKSDGLITPPGDKSSIVCESATEASETGVVTVQVHPLSPSEDVDSCVVFDSGNSLQVCYVVFGVRVCLHRVFYLDPSVICDIY